MPAPTTTRPRTGTGRRIASTLSVFLLLVTFTASCTGRQDPTSYGSGVRDDFVEGCTAGFVPEGAEADPRADEHESLCGCIYDEMSNKETGISFDDFKDAQSAIRRDPENPENTLDKLIPEFQGFVDTCEAKTKTGPLPED